MPNFRENSNEYHYVAHTYGQLSSVMEYVANTLLVMTESFEDSLMNVDRKLANYSKVGHSFVYIGMRHL